MRILIAIFVMLGALRGARANEVDDRGGRVTYLERESVRLTGERQALAKVYDEEAAGIAALKAEGASWARDRKLQALLAQSKDQAARLDRKDAELRAVAVALSGERRGLIAAIDAELGAAPAPEAARAAALAKQRAALVAAVSGRPLHVPEWTMDADDDADDLAYKAAALAQGERDLLVEEARLGARVVFFRKQAKLVKSRTRASEQDVFGDEEPRHGKPGSQSKTGRGGDEAAADTTNSPPGGSPATPTGTGGGNPTPATPADPGTSFGQPQADPHSLDLALDPSVILADVVAAGTLDELRRAERSGDPDSMARAAERAGKEVDARAARLRALRLEMEQRARQLRGETPPKTP